jgi:predicted metalloprotease
MSVTRQTRTKLQGDCFDNIYLNLAEQAKLSRNDAKEDNET